MSNTLIDTLKKINEMVTTASYYLDSKEALQLLPGSRDQLIENVTGLLADFHADDFKRFEIKALVTELVARKETEDHGWFIDVDRSTHDHVFFIHPQRKGPSETLVLKKTTALLPFNLLT